MASRSRPHSPAFLTLVLERDAGSQLIPIMALLDGSAIQPRDRVSGGAGVGGDELRHDRGIAADLLEAVEGLTLDVVGKGSPPRVRDGRQAVAGPHRVQGAD